MEEEENFLVPRKELVGQVFSPVVANRLARNLKHIWHETVVAGHEPCPN